MFCDWYAATMRHADGDIMKSIDINEERYGINPQLSQIFRNTVEFVKEKNNLGDDKDASSSMCKKRSTPRTVHK